MAWAVAIAAAVAVQLGWNLVAPQIVATPVVAFVAAFAMVAAVVIGVSAFAPSVRLVPLIVIVVAAAAMLAGATLWLREHELLGAATIMLLLVAAGTLVGGSIGHRIEHPSHLMVAAYVSSLADIYSVLSTSGVSNAVLESEALLSVVTISWGIAGTDWIAPVLGVGDVVLSAAYFAAIRHHGLSRPRMVGALAAGYLLALLAVIGFARPIPALPALGFAVVALFPEVRRLRSEDRRAAFLGMGLLTVVVGALLAADLLNP